MTGTKDRIVELAKEIAPDWNASASDELEPEILTNILGTSLAAVQLIVAIEDEFGVDLDEAVSMEFFTSFDHIASCVDSAETL